MLKEIYERPVPSLLIQETDGRYFDREGNEVSARDVGEGKGILIIKRYGGENDKQKAD